MALDPTGTPVQDDSVPTPAAMAESFGPSARVLLVHRGSPPKDQADPALELAEAVGRRGGPTLFLDLSRSSSIFSSGSSSGRPPGLSDVLAGRTTFVDATVRDPLRSFMYVPRGRDAPDGSRLIERLATSRVLDRARERGATVLVSVRAEELPDPGALTPFDGAVVVGSEGSGRIGPVGGRVPILGRLEVPRQPPEPEGKARSGRAWPRPSEGARPPAARTFAGSPSGVVFPSGSSRFRGSRTDWRFVLLICALAAALGMSLLSAVSGEDSWLRDLYRGPPDARATSQR